MNQICIYGTRTKKCKKSIQIARKNQILILIQKYEMKFAHAIKRLKICIEINSII